MTKKDKKQATDIVDVLDVIDHFPDTLRVTRILRGKSSRVVAQECGISFNTVLRVEQGEDCHMSHARALLAWIVNGDSR